MALPGSIDDIPGVRVAAAAEPSAPKVARAYKRTAKRGAVKRSAPVRQSRVRSDDDVGATRLSADEDNRAQDTRDFRDTEEITRVTRAGRQQDRFALPAHRKQRGWDYEWKVITVYGEPVDSSQMAEVHEGGWRPSKAKDFPELQVPGFVSETVERFGQRLYQRPIHLTVEARNEDYQAAEQQKRDRVQGALEGRVKGQEGLSEIKGVRAVPLGITVEGEVGTQTSRSGVA